MILTVGEKRRIARIIDEKHENLESPTTNILEYVKDSCEKTRINDELVNDNKIKLIRGGGKAILAYEYLYITHNRVYQCDATKGLLPQPPMVSLQSQRSPISTP